MPFSADQWQTSGDYLYGIDLYNFAYWWECHEVFERLWHAVGHHSLQGNLFQALIQLTAANLKYFVGNPAAGCNLIRSGIIRLQNVPPSYLGIDVLTLIETFQAQMINPRPHAPLIRLS